MHTHYKASQNYFKKSVPLTSLLLILWYKTVQVVFTISQNWLSSILFCLIHFGHLSTYKEMTEDKMVGWHHWLNGYEFEQTPGKCEGQGNLACYSPWGHNEWTGLSNWATASFVCICAMRNNISFLQCNYTETKVLVLVKITKRKNRKKISKNKLNLTMLLN